jgi:small redox-active disulfide protein 2
MRREQAIDQKEESMLTVKILGPGCANCRKMESVAREAIAALGVEAEISKVTDFTEIMAYSVLSTPALVVNGKAVCVGRIPTIADVKTWLVGASGS